MFMMFVLCYYIFANVTGTLIKILPLSVEQLALRQRSWVKWEGGWWDAELWPESTTWLSPYMWHFRLTVRRHFCAAFIMAFCVRLSPYNATTNLQLGASRYSVHS